MALLDRLCLALVAAGSAACAAPGAVDGVFQGQDFALRCDKPLAQATASNRDMLVVLEEHDSETLSTVNVLVRGVQDRALGEDIEVGDGSDETMPSIDAEVGELLIETRPDGVEVLLPKDGVISMSTGGTLVIDERDPKAIAGHFRVDLDDGGYLEGSFAAAVITDE